MKILTKKCLICGKTITKQPSRSLKDWNNRTKCCSPKCRYAYTAKILKGNKNSVGKNMHPRSEETKEKIRKALWKGGKPKCLVCSKQLSAYGAKHCKIHRPITLKTRKKRSIAIKGEKSHSWRGGITPINRKIRGSLKYKLWHEAVMKRDNWTCVLCGKKGSTLEVDHIKQFAYYPKLRFKVSNGRTLCKDCHKKTKTHSKKLKSRKVAFN